jgi:hypothetical protein
LCDTELLLFKLLNHGVQSSLIYQGSVKYDREVS